MERGKDRAVRSPVTKGRRETEITTGPEDKTDKRRARQLCHHRDQDRENLTHEGRIRVLEGESLAAVRRGAPKKPEGRGKGNNRPEKAQAAGPQGQTRHQGRGGLGRQ